MLYSSSLLASCSSSYRVLERLGPRALAAHVRTFADYLVFEFSTSHGSHVHKCVESLNNLIWKCNVVPIDRLILCMVSIYILAHSPIPMLFLVHKLL